MTRLSVNINKIATLRNARGGNNPDLIRTAVDCERYGAQGITVHPRPDERHVRYSDVMALHKVITTEFNIEGFPDERYRKMIRETKPQQATLVPDAPAVITSNVGWDVVGNLEFLKDQIKILKQWTARVSIFVNPDKQQIEAARNAGADRVELYTEPYASSYVVDRSKAVGPYIEAASFAKEIGLGVNAGHDLDRNNLRYLKDSIPFLEEVSIGHALICDALYLGLENTIQLYLRELNSID